MTDLRTAAKQALEALCLWATGRDMDAVALNDLILRLEAALAEPQEPAQEPKPVAWWLPCTPPHYHVPLLIHSSQPPAPLTPDEAKSLGWKPIFPAPPKPAAPIIEPEIKDDKPLKETT